MKTIVWICIHNFYIIFRINEYINVEIIFGDFKSLMFELSRLILAHFVRRGTDLSSRGTCPGWPRPRAATSY